MERYFIFLGFTFIVFGIMLAFIIFLPAGLAAILLLGFKIVSLLEDNGQRTLEVGSVFSFFMFVIVVLQVSFMLLAASGSAGKHGTMARVALFYFFWMLVSFFVFFFKSVKFLVKSFLIFYFV